MNITETIALIEALRASGVLKFKSSEHDIELSIFTTSPNIARTTPKLTDEPINKEAETVATEKLKNLINTINMSPEELANKIFPDGAI